MGYSELGIRAGLLTHRNEIVPNITLLYFMVFALSFCETNNWVNGMSGTITIDIIN